MQSTSRAVREREDSIAETSADGHAHLQRSLADIVSLAFDLEADELRQPWKKFELDLIRHLDLEEEHVLQPFAAAEPGPVAEIWAEHKRVRAATRFRSWRT